MRAVRERGADDAAHAGAHARPARAPHARAPQPAPAQGIQSGIPPTPPATLLPHWSCEFLFTEPR